MNKIYAQTVKIINHYPSKKNKKKPETDKIHGKCNCFSNLEKCKNMEGRRNFQDYVRTYIYTMMDCNSVYMTEEEQEVWKKALWDMSGVMKKFYTEKHGMGIWNH